MVVMAEILNAKSGDTGCVAKDLPLDHMQERLTNNVRAFQKANDLIEGPEQAEACRCLQPDRRTTQTDGRMTSTRAGVGVATRPREKTACPASAGDARPDSP